MQIFSQEFPKFTKDYYSSKIDVRVIGSPFMIQKIQLKVFSSFEDGRCMQNLHQQFSKDTKGHNSFKVHAGIIDLE
jgi:hypothetical protein